MEVSVFPTADEWTGFGIFYEVMEAIEAQFWEADDGA